MLRLSFALLLVCAAAAPGRAQGAPDRLRGRVINDSAQAVVGASVFITRGPDRKLLQTTTDSSGRWSLTFENGTGDYLVAVTAAGYANARRRVQEDGPGPHTFTADFTLARDMSTLAAVQVTAKKPERAEDRTSPFSPETGASERWTDGVEGQLAPGAQGDLNALAGNNPGVTVGANGPSILGSGAASNLTTLNGMALPGGSIPRAARPQTRVTGATYDATRGGFAGANIDVQLGAGDRNFQQRRAFLTIDQPSLQFTDAAGRALGARTNNRKGSVGLDGELIRQALTYNVSVEAGRTESDPATLLNADAATFARAGISSDSAARLRSVAGTLGIPLSGLGIPLSRERESITWLGRLDDTRDSLNQRTLTTYVSYARAGALGFAPRSAPGASGARTDRALSVQLQTSDFFGDGRRTLNRGKLAFSQSASEQSPYLALPGANVLVNSQAPDATGLTTLSLGGDSFFATNDQRWTAEGSDELMWTAGGRTHLFKALAWGRVDGLTQSGLANAAGSYSFNSIGDLAAGTPASFTRTLVQPERSGTVWNSALAFVHQWAPSRTFNVIYGARAEFDGFASAPARNGAIESALGVETGAAPMRWHVSPRVGFSWTYSRDKENGNGMNNSPVGSFYRTTTGVIRGGIGEFRDLLRPDMLADASSRTGLIGSTQQLSCVGSAAPSPNWSGWVTNPGLIPTACVGGGGVLIDSAPPATLIDRSFDVPRSWRATLDWSQNVGNFLLKVSALGSYDLNQPGTVDANFAGTQRFALASEGNRPVYVPTTAIDTASGALSSAASRRSSSFGSVGMRTSDLTGYGAQLTFVLAPDVFKMRQVFGNGFASLAYTLQESRRQYRGFDGAGFGDPRTVEWAPSANDARHIVVLQAGTFTEKFGTLTMFMRAQSGLPFTPLVEGDVNGDGRGGDRAFVPNPAATTDTSLARQLRSLLANGSATARECLTPFLGRVADRGGCRTPWSATLNMQYRLPMPGTLGRRFTASLYLDNVLGAVDQLVHGSSGMHGWGGPVNPDPVLLVPRGFDSVSKTFRYNVNPRFGETRPALTLDRMPFRITLDFQLRFHQDYDLQTLNRALEPVKVDRQWVRRSADSLAAFYLKNTSSIYKAMLEESDSLFLTRTQMTALSRADSVYSSRVRAVFVPLGRYLAQFGEAAPPKEALDSTTAAEKTYQKIFWEQPEIADSLINSTQRDLMPMLVGMLSIPKKDRENSQWQFGNPVMLVDRPGKQPKVMYNVPPPSR